MPIARNPIYFETKIQIDSKTVLSVILNGFRLLSIMQCKSRGSRKKIPEALSDTIILLNFKERLHQNAAMQGTSAFMFYIYSALRNEESNITSFETMVC